jgi:hypothetical protein
MCEAATSRCFPIVVIIWVLGVGVLLYSNGLGDAYLGEAKFQPGIAMRL